MLIVTAVSNCFARAASQEREGLLVKAFFVLETKFNTN